MRNLRFTKYVRLIALFLAVCALFGALSGCGSKPPSGSNNTWSGDNDPAQNAPETSITAYESEPEQTSNGDISDTPLTVSQFTWEVGSGSHIAIGQTKEQIDGILGESPEIPFVYNDLGDGMYRARYDYDSAGGFSIEYNRADEAVSFFAENAAVTDFLGIQMGSSSESVYDILVTAFGDEKITRDSGGYTYVVYFDSYGNAVEWTSNNFQWSYSLRLHCGSTLDIMQIYWIEGTYKQISDCKAEIVGTTWEFGYVLDPFGERRDAGDFFGTGLNNGTSLVFNDDGTFEYWIGFYDGYGTYTTDGDRILLIYEGSQNGANSVGDTGLMIYYSQYTNPYDGSVTKAVSLDFMAWDATSANNKPYNAFFVEII